MERKDLELISGSFFDLEIPKDKRYLLKYFTGKLQVSFLRYYMVFGTKKNFIDHTGLKCNESLLIRFEKRYKQLTALYDWAKKSLTEESLKTLSLIESGKFNLTKLKNFNKEI
jgi:hypothetical protein